MCYIHINNQRLANYFIFNSYPNKVAHLFSPWIGEIEVEESFITVFNMSIAYGTDARLSAAALPAFCELNNFLV